MQWHLGTEPVSVFPSGLSQVDEGLEIAVHLQGSRFKFTIRRPIKKRDVARHEAIQEGLVNALIHADYRGQDGIIVERFTDRLELSNPGIFLVSLEQMRLGAVSECRNPMLQRMFQMMGSGDRGGSGLDKIPQGWQSQHWRLPMIEELQKPDRVKLTMPMVSLLPEESLQRLRAVLGENLSGLN